MKIILNGAKMATKELAHEYLKRAFAFPDYYGRNLDALFDLLAGREETVIILMNSGKMLKSLGSYGVDLLRTFYDAAEQSERIKFFVKN